MPTFRDTFYLPKENHLGIVYSKFSQRFVGFVTPDKRAIISPFNYVLKEVSLAPRTAHIKFDNVFTADRAPLDIEVKVFYRVDLRLTNPENLVQAVNFPDAAWDSIIKTNTEELARNEVFIKLEHNHLFTHEGRQEARHAISAAIAERVRGFGLIINSLYGVAIINLQPHQVVLDALNEQSAALFQAEASARRIFSTIDRLEDVNLHDSLKAIYIQIASAITKTGKIPEAFSYDGGNTVHENRAENRFVKRNTLTTGNINISNLPTAAD